MILLVTGSPTGPRVQESLQRSLGENVIVASSATEGLRCLRQREFAAVVIDQNAALEDGGSFLVQHAGSAIPVQINAAVSSCERIVSEVKSALRRRDADRARAFRVASSELRDELRNAVTGILLSSGLALDTPSLPIVTQAKLRQVLQLAETMKRQLAI